MNLNVYTKSDGDSTEQVTVLDNVKEIVITSNLVTFVSGDTYGNSPKFTLADRTIRITQYGKGE